MMKDENITHFLIKLKRPEIPYIARTFLASYIRKVSKTGLYHKLFLNATDIIALILLLAVW